MCANQIKKFRLDQTVVEARCLTDKHLEIDRAARVEIAIQSRERPEVLEHCSAACWSVGHKILKTGSLLAKASQTQIDSFSLEQGLQAELKNLAFPPRIEFFLANDDLYAEHPSVDLIHIHFQVGTFRKLRTLGMIQAVAALKKQNGFAT